MTSTESTLSWLELPRYQPFVPRNGFEFYGAGAVAAAYCGVRPPFPVPRHGQWTHGWCPRYLARDPAIMEEYAALHLSLRGREALWGPHDECIELLNRHGFRARAIGLPIVYLPEIQVTRKPGSLLVMPVHVHNGDGSEEAYGGIDGHSYAAEINRLRSRFSDVVVCVHRADIDRAYWVEEFRNYGFTVIPGAYYADANGLKRVQTLLSGFEYVTTNGMGSHLVYGAHFGAKVSIFGPFAQYRAEDIIKQYVRYPAGNRFIELLLHGESESVMRQHYPFLFCSPIDARPQIDWGRTEVGYEHKAAPEDMRELFHWRDSDLLWWRMFGYPRELVASKTRAFLPARVKHWMKLALRPQYRRDHRERLARVTG